MAEDNTQQASYRRYDLRGKKLDSLKNLLASEGFEVKNGVDRKGFDISSSICACPASA